ncbi:RNA polymerase-associated protein RTF1 homolog [Folsomia candida]|uniref:RNA polymerase-associated protein RTF1 n=1 Tax=Folsomia candida TaxID=158441 RepID=A0A226ERJ3_FOLCA|nr:RNA polymerase-associated protein RTF1 homolog [Folsomia candida]OXA60255.1 RNA polymerase-associated protein RTF1 [Folsomia candida]
MGKRKSNALIDSDDSRSSDSDSGSGSDIDKQMLSLAKKKGPGGGAKGPDHKKVEAFSSSESDSEWRSGGESSKKTKKRKPAKRARRSASGTTYSSGSNDDWDKPSQSDNSGEEDEDRSSVSPSRSRVIPPTSSSVVSSSVNDTKSKTASDLEEGEVSDDDWDQEEFFDGYDENMMGDAEDQRTLSAMTEKEREQEIFRRIEKRDLLKNRFEAEKKLRMKKKIEAKLAKKGSVKKSDDAMLADEDDPLQMDAKVRSQERKKTVEGKVDKKSQAMDALKASRDAKIQRQQEKAKIRQERDKKRDDGDDDDLDLKKDSDAASSVGDKRMKKLKASDVYSDDSGSEYEDDKRSKDKEKSASDSDSRSSDSEDDERNKKPQYLDTVDDLNKIRLSRFKLERCLYLPFFLRVIKGCYVRVAVAGSAYKVYEIDGLDTQPKAYEIGATKTNKVLLLKLPGEEKGRKFRFEFVSNFPCTEAEFSHWKQRMEQNQVSLPTLTDIKNKEKEIKEAMEYQLEEEDIEAIINEKAKFKSGPVNFAARKAQLMKERDQAAQAGEDEKASELSGQIAVLDERATVLDKVRTSTISSISYINQRNRQRNVEEAEKAILEELKVNKGKKVEDPFTRRTTKPRIVSKPTAIANGLNGVDIFIKTEDGSETPLDKTKLANLTIDDIDSSMHNSIVDDLDGKDAQVGDLFSAHDFDIKLDLDAKLPPNLPIVARPSITAIKDTAPRRSLNLEEYKRKKGLI